MIANHIPTTVSPFSLAPPFRSFPIAFPFFLFLHFSPFSIHAPIHSPCLAPPTSKSLTLNCILSPSHSSLSPFLTVRLLSRSSGDELLDSPTSHPLDLDDIPSSFQVDDHLSQDELLQAIFQPSIIPERERDSYEKLTPNSIHLSRLKDTYEKKQAYSAIQSLHQRLKIKVDSNLRCLLEDDNLLWDVKVNRLDYILTVADKIGLWPILPRSTSDHTYTFNLDLSKPYRNFKAKYARLGFDPKASILFIGTCRNDDVWLALVPHTFSQGVGCDLPPGYVTGDTRLSTSHYRMVVMFLAAAMASIPDRGFTCHNKYGASLHGSNPDFSMHTNILYVHSYYHMTRESERSDSWYMLILQLYTADPSAQIRGSISLLYLFSNYLFILGMSM